MLDTDEGVTLSEKKVTNLTSLINGRPSDVMPLGHMTDKRIFFHRVPKQPEDAQTKVVFLARDSSGLMQENAILLLEAGVIDDE